jgi:hypothetical protein
MIVFTAALCMWGVCAEPAVNIQSKPALPRVLITTPTELDEFGEPILVPIVSAKTSTGLPPRVLWWPFGFLQCDAPQHHSIIQMNIGSWIMTTHISLLVTEWVSRLFSWFGSGALQSLLSFHKA